MKIYTNILKITFITYIMIIIERPYVTAQLWADVCLLLFFAALIYQIAYIVCLRKKENIKFCESLFTYFIYAISSVSCFIILNYINMFINGYTPNDFLGNTHGITYYGFEAIINNEWANLVYMPYLFFNIVLLVIYNLKSKKIISKD